MNRIAAWCLGLVAVGCGDDSGVDTSGTSSTTTSLGSSSTTAVPMGRVADVIDVQVSGDNMNYTFSVTVQSPDVGCDGYADWWEVTDVDGTLLFRRPFTHSHVDEQPFTREGGPIPIGETRLVYVRAHFAPDGYGGRVLLGTPGGGFMPDGDDAGPDNSELPPAAPACDF